MANIDYSNKSVKELRALAAGLVKGAGNARKADLVAALTRHDQQQEGRALAEAQTAQVEANLAERDTAAYNKLTIKELRTMLASRKTEWGTGLPRLRKPQLVEILVNDNIRRAEAKSAAKWHAEQSTKKVGPVRFSAGTKAQRAAKAPVDAQVATDPSIAKAERFAAAAAEFGWDAVRGPVEAGVQYVTVTGLNGAEISLFWNQGVYQRERAEYKRSGDDQRPIGVLNASAARKIMAANPVTQPTQPVRRSKKSDAA